MFSLLCVHLCVYATCGEIWAKFWGRLLAMDKLIWAPHQEEGPEDQTFDTRIAFLPLISFNFDTTKFVTVLGLTEGRGLVVNISCSSRVRPRFLKKNSGPHANAHAVWTRASRFDTETCGLGRFVGSCRHHCWHVLLRHRVEQFVGVICACYLMCGIMTIVTEQINLNILYLALGKGSYQISNTEACQGVRTCLSQAKCLKWPFTGCHVRLQKNCRSQAVRCTLHAESHILAARRHGCDYM